MKTWIVSYADAPFHTAEQRLMDSASRYGIDVRRSWSREALERTALYRLHQSVLDAPRGGGYWLWKPFIIHEALQEMDARDLLIYSDAGIEIVADLSPLFPICAQQGGMLTFAGHYDDCGSPGPNVCGKWTKRDCLVGMACDQPRYHNAPMSDASFLVLMKTDRTVAFVREWLLWCAQPPLLTDAPNVCGLPNLPGFIQHRHDQSILSLLVHRDGLEQFRHPSQFGNHLKDERYREPGEWVRRPYGSQGLYRNSPYPTLLWHHRGVPGQQHLRLRLRRDVSAPRERVFHAWTRSDLLERWSFGNLAVIRAEADVRVGGPYRIQLALGERRSEVRGTYLEVQPPSHLVYSWISERDAGPYVRVDFHDRGQTTAIELSHEPFASEEAREEYTGVWRSFLDLLAADLES